MSRDYILCVDDEQAVLNQLSAPAHAALRRHAPGRVRGVGRGGPGPHPGAVASSGDVQLVICDQVMPGMKGDRFLAIVSRQWPEVMKVLLTGQAGLDSAIYAINNAGLHRYVEKPWEAEDLNLTVEGLLTQYDLRRALRLLPRPTGPRRRASCAGFTAWRASCRPAPRPRTRSASPPRPRGGWRRPRLAAAVSIPDTGLPVWDRARRGRVPPELRRQLEARLAEARARPDSLALELPDSVRDVPLVHAGRARWASSS